MPHALVTRAQAVLANSSEYPEVILADAQQIVDWAQEKRNVMRAMWGNHTVLQRWVVLRSQSKGRSSVERSREATRLLSKDVSAAEMTTMHRAKQFLGKTQLNNAILFGQFAGMLNLLESNDIPQIHRYLACVNARRHDATLETVGFLRWCGMSAIGEILAWKMLTARPSSPPQTTP
jgi:hypothetical protein